MQSLPLNPENAVNTLTGAAPSPPALTQKQLPSPLFVLSLEIVHILLLLVVRASHRAAGRRDYYPRYAGIKRVVDWRGCRMFVSINNRWVVIIGRVRCSHLTPLSLKICLLGACRMADDVESEMSIIFYVEYLTFLTSKDHFLVAAKRPVGAENDHSYRGCG